MTDNNNTPDETPNQPSDETSESMPEQQTTDLIQPPKHRPMQNMGDTVRASWNIAIDKVRIGMSHCDPEARNTMIEAFLWCIHQDHLVTMDEFAKAIDYSRNTLWRVYLGKYTHPTTKQRLDVPEDMARRTREWLDIVTQRFQTQSEFVMTPTAKRIWRACDLARESRTIVMIEGVSHIGKTWALEAYQKANNHGRTVYVRLEAASGLGGMVRAIAAAMGLATDCNTAELIRRIKNGLAKGVLLIIDEVHQLVYTFQKDSFFKCLEKLREIFDCTKCGMVLCATSLLMKRAGNAKHGELEQVFRRGVHKTKLATMPTKEDLEVILKKRHGLDFPKKELLVKVGDYEDSPRRLLRELAEKEGLLSITEHLRYANKLAVKTNEPLGWQHFIHARLLIVKQATPEPDWN